MTQHHTKLKTEDRDRLAVRKAAGVSNKVTARELGKHPSSIGRELKRNRWGEGYVAIHAQRLAEERRSAAGRRHPLKNPDVYAYVIMHLRAGWSPEYIAGRLKLEHPGDRHWRICAETIYAFIHAPENAHERLWEYLPRGKPKRRKWGGRRVHASRIPERVSIHERPERVNDRTEFGHWEGDTVEGRGHRDGVRTEVERVSRRLLARKVARIASAETVAAQLDLFGQLPRTARKSTTLDNGKEHHQHTELRQLGMRTYFADPYSAWQRGTNEFHNGLLRRYFPKGTDFATVTEAELQDVVDEINHRPRKVLGFRTPAEVFAECVKGEGCDSN